MNSDTLANIYIILVSQEINEALRSGPMESNQFLIGLSLFLKQLNIRVRAYKELFGYPVPDMDEIDEPLLKELVSGSEMSSLVSFGDETLKIEVVPHKFRSLLTGILVDSAIRYSKVLVRQVDDLTERYNELNSRPRGQPDVDMVDAEPAIAKKELGSDTASVVLVREPDLSGKTDEPMNNSNISLAEEKLPETEDSVNEEGDNKQREEVAEDEEMHDLELEVKTETKAHKHDRMPSKPGKSEDEAQNVSANGDDERNSTTQSIEESSAILEKTEPEKAEVPAVIEGAQEESEVEGNEIEHQEDEEEEAEDEEAEEEEAEDDEEEEAEAEAENEKEESEEEGEADDEKDKLEIKDDSPLADDAPDVKPSSPKRLLEEIDTKTREASNKRSRSPLVHPYKHKRFQNIAINLVKSIEEHRFSSPFLTPVVAENYDEIVKHPKDLKSILRAIKQKEEPAPYATVKELEKDIMLMFANCVMYNKSSTPIVKMAMQMKNDVRNTFKMFEEAESEIS